MQPENASEGSKRQKTGRATLLKYFAKETRKHYYRFINYRCSQYTIQYYTLRVLSHLFIAIWSDQMEQNYCNHSRKLAKTFKD